MRKSYKIGEKEYKFQKDAIAYYRKILNSYDFGQSLTDSDYNSLIELLEYDYINFFISEGESAENAKKLIAEYMAETPSITSIKIAKVQFNTKCFEVFYSDNTSEYISYLMMIRNKKYNPESLFYVASRNSIHDDIHSVKQAYFDKNSVKGQVKCQETRRLSKWTELVVDHRQPNTFSIIIDRFKEVYRIDLNAIEYTSNDKNQIIFKDEALTKQFKQYHKEKASLRIVRKECNSSRTGMGRVKRSSKDLTVK